MDFILLIIGIILVLQKKWSSTLTVIAILGSEYLQIPITDPLFHNFIFPHEVKDLAIILEFILIYAFVKERGYTYETIPFKQIIYIFIFLFFSGIYDILNDVDLGDVVRQWRHWFLLSIVVVAPLFNIEEIEKSFKQLFYINAIVSIYLLFSRLTGVSVIELNIYEVERGIKPSSFSMMFAFLCVVNPWELKTSARIFWFLVFVVPIILNVKMTYVVSIVLMIGVYIMVGSNISKFKKTLLLIVLSVSSVVMVATNDKIFSRFSEMTTNIQSLSEDDMHADNFSFRLLHARERLNYIIQDPIMFIRGVGFIAEKNIKRDMFRVGLYDREMRKIRQIDTGDIAWSLFFCRLGIGGIVIFLIFYFKLITTFWNRRHDDSMSAYMLTVLCVFLFFTSLGNTIIAMDDFYIFPILFANTNYIEDSL